MWLNIYFVLFCSFTDLEIVSQNSRKKLGQYPGISTSHLANPTTTAVSYYKVNASSNCPDSRYKSRPTSPALDNRYNVYSFHFHLPLTLCIVLLLASSSSSSSLLILLPEPPRAPSACSGAP